MITTTIITYECTRLIALRMIASLKSCRTQGQPHAARRSLSSFMA